MWQCKQCGEMVEDAFDACWNCGRSWEGVDVRPFVVEGDVPEDRDWGEVRRYLYGSAAGAVTTAVLIFISVSIPFWTAFGDDPRVRANLGFVLFAITAWSLVSAGAGGGAGWIGSRTDRLTDAGWKGAIVVLAFQVFLGFSSGSSALFWQTTFRKKCAILVSVSAVGAIAGSVGLIFGRPRPTQEGCGDRVQFSLIESLFVTTLFGVLFSSVAVVSG